jgi:hypothetical protein
MSFSELQCTNCCVVKSDCAAIGSHTYRQLPDMYARGQRAIFYKGIDAESNQKPYFTDHVPSGSARSCVLQCCAGPKTIWPITHKTWHLQYHRSFHLYCLELYSICQRKKLLHTPQLYATHALSGSGFIAETRMLVQTHRGTHDCQGRTLSPLKSCPFCVTASEHPPTRLWTGAKASRPCYLPKSKQQTYCSMSSACHFSCIRSSSWSSNDIIPSTESNIWSFKRT